MAQAYVLPLESLRMADVPTVGGKNASLGELISQLSAAGVRVPGGFATTAQAYVDFLRESGLKARIDEALDRLDVDDVTALAKTGAEIRAEFEAKHPGRAWPRYDPGGMVTNLFLKPPGWRAAEGLGQPALGYPR